MKAGILTFHAAHNFGAMLQTYALCRAIEKLGHEACVINYYPSKADLLDRQIRWTLSPKQILKNIYAIGQWSDWRCRDERFIRFMENYPGITKRYRTADELRNDPPDIDVYISGSDQIWNAERGVNPVRLLNFVEEGRKVSYAASFGSEYVDDRSVELFEEFLPQYDFLSCREKEGVRMIKEMAGVEAVQTVDPIFLLRDDEWRELSVEPDLTEPYLLVYCLQETPAFMELVEKVSKRLRLRVVLIGQTVKNRFKYADQIIRNAGPAEFVGLFRKAEFVCTNSFHGTAFSIKFGRNFLTVPHTTRNSRFISLLALAGLQDRQLPDLGVLDGWAETQFSIDYTKANTLLQREVDRSADFLKRALEYSVIQTRLSA